MKMHTFRIKKTKTKQNQFLSLVSQTMKKDLTVKKKQRLERVKLNRSLNPETEKGKDSFKGTD